MFKKKQLGPGGYRRATPVSGAQSPIEPSTSMESLSEPIQLPETGKSLDPFVESLYKTLKSRWNFMTTDDFAQFDPVGVALSFMDNSSLGRDYSSFSSTLEDLEKAMDIIVKEYHTDFSQVISTFAGVVEGVMDANQRAEDMKNDLSLTKHMLEESTPDLHDLWIRNLQYHETLRLMDAIDELRKAPTKVEALANGKHFLTATRTLSKAQTLVGSEEFAELGALSDVRVQLTQLRAKIKESIINDLHDHIYLKSSYSQSRALVATTNDSSPVKSSPSKPKKSETGELEEDLDSDPQLDSYHYMDILVESMKELDCLSEAVDVIRDRLPLELYDLVERTIEDVEMRHPEIMNAKTVLSLPDQGHSSNFLLKIPDLLALDSQAYQAETLKDLMTTLYERLEVVMQAHFSVCSNIAYKMKDPSSSYTITEVWAALQGEVKSMLFAYLANKEDADALEAMKATSGPAAFLRRASKISHGLRPFAFQTRIIDPATIDLYKRVPQVPSIASTNDHEKTVAVDTKERTGHKLLVPPDPRRVLTVYQPTTNFVERMEMILAAEGVDPTEFTEFLNSFVLDVFLPEIEDAVLSQFNDFINHDEAFRVVMDPAICPYPLLRSSLAVILLTQGICKTLRKIPAHQDQFARIVEGVLTKYYERCEQRFFDITNAENSELQDNDASSDCISATWAQNISIKKPLVQNSNFLGGTRNMLRDEELSEQELKIELDLKKERSFHRGELIFDVKRLWSLANMHFGMDWFVEQIWRIRTLPLSRLAIVPSENSIDVDGQTWYQLTELTLEQTEQDQVALPLPSDTAQRYDNILQKFERLAERCLFTLRIEYRCHTMYYLDLAMREGSYFLDAAPEDPDPFVLGLNADLMKADELMSAGLPPRKVRFLFDGLAGLMTTIMIKDFRYIRRMNNNGKKKLIRNVHALQQNLSNITGRFESRFNDVVQFVEKS